MTTPATPPQTPRKNSPPSSSSPLSSPGTIPGPPIHLPSNPFNPRTSEGHRHIRRRDNPKIPTDIDKWLQANISLWPREDPRLASTNLVREDVLCTIEMVYFEAVQPEDHDDPFLEAEMNRTLFLTVTASPTSSIPPRYHKSPPAILARWEGPLPNNCAPDWTLTWSPGDSISFPQPRAVISDLFAKLAMSEENQEEGYSNDMLRWAETISLVREAFRVVRARARKYHTSTNTRLSEKTDRIPLRVIPPLASRPSKPRVPYHKKHISLGRLLYRR
ncbi:hypothetical protein OF83DRAFT_1180443 [Amylostereum chailletii]|nr:hypothetical protein OF83DRAFT_1180443 [Amylostereum chailletii]